MTVTWSTACPDWEQRITAGRSLVPCPPLFPDEAEAALRVFKALPVVDLPGVPDGHGGTRPPTFGEVCRPFVFDFVAAIFGAYDEVSGQRLINDFFLLISKKNGKSTIAAGIMMTALIRNWRLSNELIIIAPTIEVAQNSAKPAMAMVQRNAELATVLRPVPHQRLIEHRTTRAELKILAADSQVVSGAKAGFILFDEWWLFGKMSKAEDMAREATGGLASRPEGFVIKLSTMSDEPPAGVFKSDLDRFRGIRDGKIEAPESLGLLYEFPPPMVKSGEYEHPENFYVTNPNLTASVSARFLTQELRTARTKGPVALAGFFAKHLNVEIGAKLRGNGWPGAEHWERRADPALTLDALLARCEAIVAGVDGGGLDDLFGLNIVGRETGTKRWLSWSHSWCHEGVLERRNSIASLLQDFAAAGDLTIVSDELEDVTAVVSVIEKIKDAGLLVAVAVDPACIGQLVDALAMIDVKQENQDSGQDYLIGVRQGLALMSSLKTVERKLADGTFVHADQLLMNWCVSNIKIEHLPTGIRATKQNAGDAKVDTAFALFDACVVMSTNPEGPRSAYAERDLITI